MVEFRPQVVQQLLYPGWTGGRRWLQHSCCPRGVGQVLRLHLGEHLLTRAQQRTQPRRMPLLPWKLQLWWLLLLLLLLWPLHSSWRELLVCMMADCRSCWPGEQRVM